MAGQYVVESFRPSEHLLGRTTAELYDALSALALLPVDPEAVPELLAAHTPNDFSLHYRSLLQREHVDDYGHGRRLGKADISRKMDRAYRQMAVNVNHRYNDGVTNRANAEKWAAERELEGRVAARLAMWRLEIWFDPKLEDLEAVNDPMPYLRVA